MTASSWLRPRGRRSRDETRMGAHHRRSPQSSGRRVPEDLSILAVCPSDVAFGQPVRLSSIDVPGNALGAIAVEMVMDQLAGRREPETRLLAPKLTERDSCGSPPASRDTTRRS